MIAGLISVGKYSYMGSARDKKTKDTRTCGIPILRPDRSEEPTHRDTSLSHSATAFSRVSGIAAEGSRRSY